MALLLMDGFDKYGGINNIAANVQALLTQGEWTTATGGLGIVAPLSATGFALSFVSPAVTLSKTLAGNYTELLGGVRFSSPLSTINGVQFMDISTAQASISVNVNGTFSVRNGNFTSGTILGTSTVAITANTVHTLTWDIILHNTAGAYQLWLDGISILSGSAVDMTATVNNYANQAQLVGQSGNGWTIDDFFIQDTSGPPPLNAPLLDSPRIETQFPVSDGAVQFAVGAAVLGSTVARSTVAYNATANNLYLRPFTPTVNCTISAIGLMPGGTNGTIQLRPVLYADSAGVPGALMSAGSTVVGITSGNQLIAPLTTPQNLVSGTRYWLGWMNDITQSAAYAGADTSVSGRWVLSTFASGAPSTAPAMTAGQVTAAVFGVVTGAGSNVYSVQQNPAQGSYSYVYASGLVEDFYNFSPLLVVPSVIYATAIKSNVAKSDAGAKTISLRQKSGSTNSGGGVQAPGTSFAWLTSLFPTDPNGGVIWTKAALDAAQGGVRIES